MRNYQQWLTACALCAGAALAWPVAADTVSVPLGQQGEQLAQRPAHGSTKAQVEDQFGSPMAKHGPVGEPAIYYWEYPGYTVYFEDNWVLHSVLKHHSPEG